MTSMNGLSITGTGGEVGKTMITLAIAAALVRRGFVVHTFKGGPDFLDTGHLSCILGRSARDLDAWEMDAGAIHFRFRAAPGAARSFVRVARSRWLSGKVA